MILTIVEFILKLMVPVVGYYFDRQEQKEQARKDYLAFLEIMERNQLVSVNARLKATDQIDRVKKLWEEENKNEKQ